ncbi:MAG: recombination mediator RecR [Cyclobacteriaceae bacterium]
MEYPSKLIERAVEEISRLPGIGKKTALRLALHLLKKPEEETANLSFALQELRNKIQYCKKCHMISDGETCSTCTSAYRDPSMICVVEDSPDVLAILNTAQYSGHFHVLGGRISPMDGIGPDQINIETLIRRVKAGGIAEIVLALSATMEGDTTSYYITKMLKDEGVKVTTITRGIPVGSEIEYADEVTLGRSILTRTEVKD